MLKNNLIANYLGQGWVALMGFAFIPIYIKYLGIEAYGLIGAFASLQLWLSLLDMGLSASFGREFSSYLGGSNNPKYIFDLLRSAESISIGIGVLVVIFVYLISDFLLLNWLNLEKLPIETAKFSLSVLSLVISLRFIEVIYRSALVGLQKQVIYNLLSSSMATLRACGTILALIYIGPTLEVFFLSQLTASIITVVIFHIFSYRSMPVPIDIPKFSLSIIFGLKSFAIGALVFNFLNILLTQVDKVILMKLLPLSEYGFYTLATTLSGALFILIGPIVQAVYPRICELHTKQDSKYFSITYHNAAQLVSVLFGSAAIVMITHSELILQIWTHDEVLSSEVAPLLSVLALGNLLNGLLWLPFQAQLAIGWTGLLVRSNIVAVLVIIPLILIVTPDFGTLGAAWVWVLLNVCYLLVTIHLMHRKIMYSEKWQWYFYDCGLPIFLGFLMMLLIKKIFSLEFFNNFNSYFYLILVILSALISTALSTSICRKFIHKYHYINKINIL